MFHSALEADPDGGLQGVVLERAHVDQDVIFFAKL